MGGGGNYWTENWLLVTLWHNGLNLDLFSHSADLTEPPQAVITTPTSEAEAEAGPAADSEQPGTSGEAAALTIDGIPIPDGVDPSFLEALPEAIRREVLAEQLGLHPPPASQRNTAADENEGSTDLNVSPEFLAALPPDVQEEVRLLVSWEWILCNFTFTLGFCVLNFANFMTDTSKAPKCSSP